MNSELGWEETPSGGMVLRAFGHAPRVRRDAIGIASILDVG